MPTNRPRPNETREMRVFGKVVELNAAVLDNGLPEFIARRRLPGADWRTWDEIVFELAEVTGEIVTNGTLRQWAKRYGIPEDTSRNAGTAAFRQALKRQAITIGGD